MNGSREERRVVRELPTTQFEGGRKVYAFSFCGSKVHRAEIRISHFQSLS